MTMIRVATGTKSIGKLLQMILPYSLVFICTVHVRPSQHKLVCAQIENDTTNFIAFIRLTRLLNAT